MADNFATMQDEVKRRATRDQGGTAYDNAVQRAINWALFRTSREAPWRTLRRKTTFDTIGSYTKGTGNAVLTSGSATATISSATMLTDGVQIDRKVKFSATGTYFYVAQVTGETSMVLDQTYYGSTTTGCTYEVLPQTEYNLPIQAGHRMFMWHEAYGYPFKMSYITDQDFYSHGVYLTIKYIPTHYRMWGEDMVKEQLRSPSTITISSSSASDTSKNITVFGMVSGYPDYEVITTNASNGTTTVTGSKTFQSVERVTKTASTVGRITVTANSAVTTVAVLPVGDTTSGILYRKIQLYPLPTTVFPMHVQYYKDPYKLVNDDDNHEMGEAFNEAIILLATAKLKAEQNQAEADRYMLLYADELRSLKKTNVDKIDWFPRLKKPAQGKQDLLVTSNLLYRQAGANFGPASRS